jgi:hypothetical protein
MEAPRASVHRNLATQIGDVVMLEPSGRAVEAAGAIAESELDELAGTQPEQHVELWAVGAVGRGAGGRGVGGRGVGGPPQRRAYENRHHNPAEIAAEQ